ncbi:MAG: asparagine synthase (glutamine-hydrolyzing) [Ekhidna sp.]|nr:asparagine synthase (glutamine-hydrolyzing) [Ekhidna sp.]
MCGVCGVYSISGQSSIDVNALKRMNDLLSHRGPDEEGLFIDDANGIGLGHKRLSIIDLDEGQQPMSLKAGDEEFTITYNGEIYNYIELKEELEKMVYKFKTNSDTEVLLMSYLEWGEDCVSHFNGVWAFAIWRASDKSLFISRDRIGEKPLYYYLDRDRIYFASELSPLLNTNLKITPNFEVLKLYLLLCFVPAPHTFYKEIKQLEAGHNILIQGGSVTFKKYWDLPLIDESSLLKNTPKVQKEFEVLLQDSVRLRMRSDVPFGAFLSGGLDSSSIVSIMSQYSNNEVSTFSIGSEEKDFDERALARMVADQYATSHHEKVVEPEIYEDSLVKVLDHFGEPFGDSSAIMTRIVSDLASQHVKMVLTGDGGDEVLSGYTTYQGEKFASYYQKIPRLVGKSIPQIISFLSQPLSNRYRYKANRVSSVLKSSLLSFVDRLSIKTGQLSPYLINQLTDINAKKIGWEEFYHNKFSFLPVSLNNFYRLMYWNLKVSLPDDMLRKVDRMSMACSLEARIPFLDHRLIELMVAVDKKVKMNKFQRKSILRNTTAKSLPKPLLRAKKMGFSVPMREWFKKAELLKSVRDLGDLHEHLDRTVWTRILENNQAGQLDAGNFIWSVAILKKWIERL